MLSLVCRLFLERLDNGDRLRADLKPASDQTVPLFWALMLLHIVVWTLIPFLTQPNAQLDTIEMLFCGHEWQWGYYKHPPLPAWIAEVISMASGKSLLCIYLVSQILGVVTFWSVWRLGREMLSPGRALGCAALLETCFFYNYYTSDINNSIIVGPFRALAVLMLYWALQRNQWRYWLGLGVCLGLGMLSKYDTAITALSMLALPLFDRRVRQAFLRPGPYIATAVALALFAPHVNWLIANDFPTFKYVNIRSHSSDDWYNHLLNPLSFLVSQAASYLPMAVCALPVLHWNWDTRQRKDTEKFQRLFALLMGLFPIGFILSYSAISGNRINAMWGSAVWTYFPLTLMMCLKPRASAQGWQRVFVCGAVATVVLAVALTVRNTCGPYFRDKTSRIHYPGESLANEVSKRWEERYHKPVPMVAGFWWDAANVSFYLPQRTTVYATQRWNTPEGLGEEYSVSPWVDDQVVRKEGAVVIWNFDKQGEALPEIWQKSYPDCEILDPIELDWQTGADIKPLRVGMAIIPSLDGSSGASMQR